MPPELWANQPYTFSSDLWALGCCLYELMTYRWVTLWPRAAAELPLCMVLSRAACAHHPSAQHLTSSQMPVGRSCCEYTVSTCRVPFEAKSMAELRSKVMSGTIKPVTPGKYSVDLVLLMQSLLQTAPGKRTPLDKILASSAVQKRMGGTKAAPGDSAESHVIGTIKARGSYP